MLVKGATDLVRSQSHELGLSNYRINPRVIFHCNLITINPCNQVSIFRSSKSITHAFRLSEYVTKSHPTHHAILRPIAISNYIFTYIFFYLPVVIIQFEWYLSQWYFNQYLYNFFKDNHPLFRCIHVKILRYLLPALGPDCIELLADWNKLHISIA